MSLLSHLFSIYIIAKIFYFCKYQIRKCLLTIFHILLLAAIEMLISCQPKEY